MSENNKKSEIQEFTAFIKEAMASFNDEDTFESVLANTVKMDMYIKIYETLTNLPAKRMKLLAEAASSLMK